MSLTLQASGVRGREVFQLYLIKPSHYDDDGYVIQWRRSYIPSNSLAALYGIAEDCAARRVLGDEVELRVTIKDEMDTRVVPKRLIRDFKRLGGRGLVAMVGVQSNQFPRAVDLARPLRAAGIPVCIGGFHAAGTLAMLPEPTPEIRAAWNLGISLFSGEAEGRLDELLCDAWEGELKPLYDYRNDLPNMEGTPTPFLPREIVGRNLGWISSFDAGRGCPFQCSFCTIINVQGRKSRHRSPDDVEQIIRKNHAQGITSFFITDDNFARNRMWEPIFDRMIALREAGLKSNVIIQVDTLCHRIPNFIQKARRAGVVRVFIGLESIAPDNLLAAKKKQNRITEYRTMLQAWKSVGVITICGVIVGFPNDTPARLKHDVEIIKRELPVDLVEFFCLTPLPGSEDHQTLHKNGVPMEPDLNQYDTEHVTTGHPLMSAEEWFGAYRDAWRSFYEPTHVETVIRRAVACGIPAARIEPTLLRFYSSAVIEGIHPLQAGEFRKKFRRDRRPGMPRESIAVFYARYGWEILSKRRRLRKLTREYRGISERIAADPNAKNYRDLALTPVVEDEALEIFSASESAKQAVEKVKRQKAPLARAAAG